MKRFDAASIAMAVGLSGLAGYVDALGFLHLGGTFVSFMSGNSTRLGVGLANRDTLQATLSAAIIAGFVAGVVAGSLLGEAWPAQRRRNVLALETALLTGAAALSGLGHPGPAIAAVVLAMGAENAVFQRDGDVAIGLTYMTGTLVKMGQRLASALRGGPGWAFLPYALLWGGLTGGAVLGSLAYRVWGLGGLWAAAGWAATLGVVAAVRGSGETAT